MHRPVKGIAGIAKALIILQWVMLGVTAATLIAQVVIASKASDFLDGTIDIDDFEDSLAPLLLIGFLVLGVAIATMVLQIVWSYRIAGNLQTLGRDITWKPGLSIVAWLLGGCTVNIITFLMLREHWKASDPDTRYYGDQQWKTGSVSPLIVGWFVSVLAQVVLGFSSGLQNVGGFNFDSDTDRYAEALSDRLPYLVLSGIVTVVGAVLMIMIVRQLTDRHRRAIGEA